MCKCFCFVLFVKEYDWLEGGEIIVVVNVGSEDDEYVVFNDKFIFIVNDYVFLLKGSVNLVNSYFFILFNIVIEVFEFDFDIYYDVVKNYYLKEMCSYVLKYGIFENKCVVREGFLEKVIL